MKIKKIFIYTLMISLMLSTVGCVGKKDTVETPKNSEATMNNTNIEQDLTESKTHGSTSLSKTVPNSNANNGLYPLHNKQAEKKNIFIYLKRISCDKNNIIVTLIIKNNNLFDIWFQNEFDGINNAVQIHLRNDKDEDVLYAYELHPNEKQIVMLADSESEVTYTGSYTGKFIKTDNVTVLGSFELETSEPNSFFEGEKTVHGQVTTKVGISAGFSHVKYSEIAHLIY